MGRNDWLSGRPTVDGGNRSGRNGRELTAITSEIDSLADSRKDIMGEMSKQLALYCRQVQQGNIHAPNTATVQDHLRSLVNRTNLTDADAKDVLINALAMFLMN